MRRLKIEKIRHSVTEFHLSLLATTKDKPVSRAASLIRFSLDRFYCVLIRLCAAVLRWFFFLLAHADHRSIVDDTRFSSLCKNLIKSDIHGWFHDRMSVPSAFGIGVEMVRHCHNPAGDRGAESVD